MTDERKRGALIASHLQGGDAKGSRVKLSRLLSGPLKAGQFGETVEFDGKEYMVVEELAGFAFAVELGQEMPAPLVLIPASYKGRKAP